MNQMRNKIIVISFGLVIISVLVPISAQLIPDYVKNIAGWYATDQVSEQEFMNAIEYMIDNQIIKPKIIADKNAQIEELQNQINSVPNSAQISEMIIENANNREAVERLERIDNYLDSKGIAIPSWVWNDEPEPINESVKKIDWRDETRRIAGQYSNNQIGDTDYINQIQDLINRKILILGQPKESCTNIALPLPIWVKEVSGFWAKATAMEYDYIHLLVCMKESGLLN